VSAELIIVANRLPIRAAARGHPEARWERSPGGLVSALHPVIGSFRTTWVGSPGGVAGTDPPAHLDGLHLVPVHLTKRELSGFYAGFSNTTLWPLYHDAIVVPQFQESWWRSYVAVNQRFAATVCSVAAEGATVWVHDYHLHLVPQLIRTSRPDLRIGFFLHIPFPAQELFMRLPTREALIDGLLGADVVGFQTIVGAQNFRQVARRLRGCRTTGKVVHNDGRRTLVDAFPVGVDADRIRDVAATPATIERAKRIRADLGNPRIVLLGVDRLDYTKGIVARLSAYRALLEERRIDPADVVLIQIAEPSRDDVPGYAEIRTEVEQLVGSINGDYGTMNGVVVKYLHRSHSFTELIALYRAADVMLVTPYRDGMNLVAKEYVAARLDRTGTLILSEFAGAAHQLSAARLVNPFDLQSLKTAIDDAVNRPNNETRTMATLARRVAKNDALHWASTFLSELNRR
jgi:trehalose 6-phosphate synthase